MVIWVTGNSGGIGENLIPGLESKENTVIGFSRSFTINADVCYSVDLSAVDSIHVLQGAVSEYGAPDVVFHLAALQPTSGRQDVDYLNSNVASTVNLFYVLQGGPLKHFIYTSTQRVYGDTPFAFYTEEVVPHPTTMYGLTKLWAENLIFHQKDYLYFRNTCFTVLRLPSIYGAGGDSFLDGIAKTAISGEDIVLFGKGERIIDLLHIDDVVLLLSRFIGETPRPGYSLFNLGCGQRLTTYHVVQALVDSLSSSSKIVLSEVKMSKGRESGYADIVLARRVLGFSPTPFKESIKRYADELLAKQR